MVVGDASFYPHSADYYVSYFFTSFQTHPTPIRAACLQFSPDSRPGGVHIEKNICTICTTNKITPITVGEKKPTYHHCWSNLGAASTNRWTTRTPRQRMLRRRRWSEWERSTDALWTCFMRDWCFITAWRTSYLGSWRRCARCCSAFTAPPAGTITASSPTIFYFALSFFPRDMVPLKRDHVFDSFLCQPPCAQKPRAIGEDQSNNRSVDHTISQNTE